MAQQFSTASQQMHARLGCGALLICVVFRLKPYFSPRHAVGLNIRKNSTKPGRFLQVPNALESTTVRQVFHAVTVGGVGVHDMPLVARNDPTGRLAVRVPNVQDDPHARILPIPPTDDDDDESGDHSAAAAATVRVEAHDPDWARRFGCIRERALTALQGITTRIEHVGSTSVPGLAAKPIIDMDAIIADESLLPTAVAALRPLGYAHRGELGIDGRHAFRYSGPTDGARTPFWRYFISNAKRSSFAETGSGHTGTTLKNDSGSAGGGERNFYVCIDGADALKNHLVLRDHLRGHPEAVAEYSNLKARLAEQFPNDIDAYVDGKTDLIVRMLAEAGFGEKGLDAIEQANRLQKQEEVEAGKSFFPLFILKLIIFIKTGSGQT
jgi:GrpB-like predicted nucleotidyltransferase (UPF0157 family)